MNLYFRDIIDKTLFGSKKEAPQSQRVGGLVETAQIKLRCATRVALSVRVCGCLSSGFREAEYQRKGSVYCTLWPTTIVDNRGAPTFSSVLLHFVEEALSKPLKCPLILALKLCHYR